MINYQPSKSSTIYIQHWHLYRGITETRSKISQKYPCNEGTCGMGPHNTCE
jgi:hypothetical protein